VGAHGLNRRPFAGANFSDMGKGVVGGDRHLPAKRVHFPCQVALGRSADAAIAGQVADAREVERDARSFAPYSGSRKGGFDAGMAGTHHKDVKTLHG
jgi:hypothetical protein